MKKEEIKKMDLVKQVDLERYMGTWYEIARFPNSFEKNLVGVTATYSLKENGKVDVLNQGYKNSLDGKLEKAKGFAKLPDKSQPGWLKVYFFWPFGGDYLILELDQENYQYVLVGSPKKDYLWILSRTPKMEQATYDNLVIKAKERGYDVSKLQMVEQK
ncbi:MAG TPA: lipocalin family protein [Bacteroidales bacterium]|nr:lipocalin family protein [Bacteroidales bacterium]HRX96111.1 lipocalin family protein [Bacteroidales bacterium]